MGRIQGFESRPVCAVALAVVCAVGIGACSPPADAQPMQAPCGSSPDMPGDLSLQISLKNGQTVFREGEIIGLTAEYKSSEKNKYVLTTGNYDRSGRLNGMETLCLDPNTGADPLSDYFNSMMAIFGGGLFSMEDPAQNPFDVPLELNEWQSLPPGSYRLTVTGNRVSPQGEDVFPWRRVERIALRSNAVEFQILAAEPDWQAAQLAAVVATLDSPSASDEEKKHAARVLRFLGSEASTRELARRYWSSEQPFGSEFKFGLFGSPRRDTAIQAMHQAIESPDHPVTSEFVATLATLELQSDPKFRLPVYDEVDQLAWYQASDLYWAEHKKRAAGYLAEAAVQVSGKSGEARAVTVSELLQSRTAQTPQAKAQLRQMLIASWDALPVRMQNDLLAYRWAQVGGPEWLPLLEKIVAGEPNPRHLVAKLGREAALRRILDLSPEEGRSMILKEVAAPQGDIGIGLLGQLPEHELPQIEASTIARIRAGGSDVDFHLIDRYAGVRTLASVQSIYEAHRGAWACSEQTAMLRYFLRVGPDYGAQEVAAAFALRNQTGCYRTLLSDLGEWIRSPQMEHLAILALDDPALDAAHDAAEALRHYGSAHAEAALWARLERFHRQWKDVPDVRLHPHPGAIEFSQPSGLEHALVHAISGGQAWFADAETVRRLKRLSSPAMQPDLDEIERSLQQGSFGGFLTWLPDGQFQFSIAWYRGTGLAALREKLAQFPSGSHLNVSLSEDDREMHAADVDELVAEAAANGVSLQR